MYRQLQHVIYEAYMNKKDQEKLENHTKLFENTIYYKLYLQKRELKEGWIVLAS